jgi:hypothetical protein
MLLVTRDIKGYYIQIYSTMIQRLYSYRSCILELDYRHIEPQLDKWSYILVHHTGCVQENLFSADGENLGG